MPHLANDLLTSDPECLARLREMLHGPQVKPLPMPDLAERFGVARTVEAIVPALARKSRRRRAASASASAPASLVTP